VLTEESQIIRRDRAGGAGFAEVVEVYAAAYRTSSPMGVCSV